MKVVSFKGLEVWQKAHQSALSIYRITKLFPSEERFGLISQIRRSATSIPANIAEGYKKSTKEFIRFLVIAEGSLEETKYHIILSKDLGYCNSIEFAKLNNQLDEVGRMLSGLIKRLRIK